MIPSREELFAETVSILADLAPQQRADLTELVSGLLFIVETGERAGANQLVDQAIELLEGLKIDRSDAMQLLPKQADAIAIRDMWIGLHHRGETL